MKALPFLAIAVFVLLVAWFVTRIWLAWYLRREDKRREERDHFPPP